MNFVEFWSMYIALMSTPQFWSQRVPEHIGAHVLFDKSTTVLKNRVGSVFTLPRYVSIIWRKGKAPMEVLTSNRDKARSCLTKPKLSYGVASVSRNPLFAPKVSSSRNSKEVVKYWCLQKRKGAWKVVRPRRNREWWRWCRRPKSELDPEELVGRAEKSDLPVDMVTGSVRSWEEQR